MASFLHTLEKAYSTPTITCGYKVHFHIKVCMYFIYFTQKAYAYDKRLTAK